MDANETLAAVRAEIARRLTDYSNRHDPAAEDALIVALLQTHALLCDWVEGKLLPADVYEMAMAEWSRYEPDPDALIQAARHDAAREVLALLAAEYVEVRG